MRVRPLIPPDPPLRDADIVLRLSREDDAIAIREVYSEPDTRRWMGWGGGLPDDAEARANIARSASAWEEGTWAVFRIADADSDEVIGGINLHLGEHETAEISYFLRVSARGRGLATRAVRLVAQWAFEELGIERIELRVHPDNTASRQVAERAGFAEEGVERASRAWPDGTRFDSIVFSLLARDLRQPGYSEEETGRLELIWGDGFLSPGGPAEVARILGGHEIAGCSVLDIGSGAGGVDITLVRNHGARTVVGVDVQRELVDLAAERAVAAGLGSRVTYQIIDSGELPFADASFDIVFSKDAIIHVQDKDALYAEAFRVLRSDGRMLVGDWLRGEGDDLSPQVEAFVEAAGHGFAMVSLRDIRSIVARVGFDEIEVEDRRAWYLGEATAELERLRGDMRPEFVERWSDDAAQAEIEFWEVLVASLTTGALSPGHIRARKPPEGSRVRGQSKRVRHEGGSTR